MKSFSRAERVSSQIQKALSDMLHKRIKDPRLQMATITGVKMTKDLRLARIYFITSGQNKNTEGVIEGFNNALGYIKRSLASQLDLKYMPDIKFYYDDSFDYGSRIDSLLSKIKNNHESNS